jgi:hypothetical protein
MFASKISGATSSVTYTADDLVVVSEMSLAVLAAINALGIKIDVVGEAHLED